MPLRAGGSRNRMLQLLYWDTYMCAICVLLWFGLYYLTMRTYAVQAGLETGVTFNEFQIFWLWVTGWDTWQCQITFAVVKVFFMLSSAPFFIFTIGGLNKLFTHTEASAYTRDGI